MKVLLINSVCDFGSTGKICIDISKKIIAEGNECWIAYGQGSSTYEYSYRFSSKLENDIHNLYSRIIGKQGYCSTNGTKKLLKFIEEYQPDYIHLHNLHGNYLNNGMLFKFLAKYKGGIIWTLHDCWGFTGNCSYYNDVGCIKWETECNNCPQLMKYPPSHFFDFTKEMYHNKAENYSKLDSSKVKIHTVSYWLQSQVEKSILNNFSIKTIYNWIPHDIFKPIENKNEVKAKYNLSETKKIVLGVSASWYQNNKLQRFLKLNELLSDEYELVLVGKKSVELPADIKHIEYVHGKEELNKLYNASDVFIHLSTEDTFGLVIGEALSSGTPVIVFNASACPEVVGSDEFGAIVEVDNIGAIYENIQRLCSQEKESYAQKCRNRVLEKFDYKNNIEEIYKLYSSME